MKRCFLILIFGGFTFVKAQEKVKPYFSYSLNYFFSGANGKFNDNYDGVFLPNPPSGFEITINKISTGKNRWEKHWHYPNVGLSLAYINYNSVVPTEDLGRSYAITPFLEQFVIRKKRWNFSIATGIGLAYHDRIYDAQTNARNVAISTRITASFLADFKLQVHLSKQFSLQGIFSFRHFSNGAVRVRNFGINMLYYGAGIIWTPFPREIIRTKDSTHLLKKRVRVNIEFGGNKKAVNVGDYFRYTILSAGIYVSKRVSKINTLLVGIDLYYDEGVRGDYWAYNQNKPGYDNLDTTNISKEYLKVVGLIGTEIFINKFSYTPTFGWHLHQGRNFNGNFVHRHTLKYYLHDHFYIKTALKVFGGAADSFDIGIGVRI
jgi:hypothetical protein